MARWLALALAAGAAADVNDSSMKYQLPITQPVVIDHCFYRDMRYFPGMISNLPSREESLLACQERCVKVPGCKYISWWGSGHCVLSDSDAYLVQDVYAIAGPLHCTPILASCRERPNADFPGPTSIDSAKAWPSGYVPFPLECWPRTGTNLERVMNLEPCGKEEVIQNISTGLEANCQNLELLVVPLYHTCHSLCSQRPFCSIYVDNETGCFIGEVTAGLNCLGPLRSTKPPNHAGRLMHGEVRVLQDLRDTQVFGLKQVFLERDCHGDPRGSCVEFCRLACYSSLQCNFWQYYLGSGCWLDEGDVLHPLTNANLHRGYPIAIAGEYIQHFCPGLGWTPAKAATQPWLYLGSHHDPVRNCALDQEWTLTASNTICSKTSKVKELKPVFSVKGCQVQAQNTEECGKMAFTNGTGCFCLLAKGPGLCQRQHLTGFDLYERKDLVDVVQPEEHASLFKAPKGLGNLHVEITLKGVSYERVMESKSVSDELRSSFAVDVASAAGVSSSSVWNDQGDTREVSLDRAAAEFGDKYLRIDFNMQLPGHGSADFVTRDLNSLDFQASLRETLNEAAPDSLTGPVQAFVAFGEEEPVAPFSYFWIPILLAISCCVSVVLCFVCGVQNQQGMHLEDFQCDNPLDGLCDTDSDREKQSPKSVRAKRWFQPQSRNVQPSDASAATWRSR